MLQQEVVLYAHKLAALKKKNFLVDNSGKGLFGWATATGQRENEAILTNYPWVSEDEK